MRKQKNQEQSRKKKHYKTKTTTGKGNTAWNKRHNPTHSKTKLKTTHAILENMTNTRQIQASINSER